MGTAFTYQGRLTDGGSPADGEYDFRFRLYDAASGDRLPVSDGSGQRLPNDQVILPIEITVEGNQ